MRTSAPIEVIVHCPKNEADERELARRAAELHADFVMSAIEKLDCSANQKQELLWAIKDMYRSKR